MDLSRIRINPGKLESTINFISYDSHPPTILHSPEGSNHSHREKYAGDDTASAEEDHFIFDVVHHARLLCNVEVCDKGLESFFIHIISKIAYCCGEYKAKENGAADDEYFDPFEAGDKGNGEEKDVACEGDKHGDQQGILIIEGKLQGVLPDGVKDEDDDYGGDYPPE